MVFLLNDKMLSLLSILGFVCCFVGTVLPYWSHFQEPCQHITCTSHISTSLFYVKNCTTNMGCWYKNFYDPFQQEQYFGDAKDRLVPILVVTQGKCILSLLLSLGAIVLIVNAACKQERHRPIWILLLLSFSGLLMLSIVADFIVTYTMNYNKANSLGSFPYSAILVLLGVCLYVFIVIDGFSKPLGSIRYRKMSEDVELPSIPNDE